MSKFINNLRQSGALTFWLGVLVLVLVIATTTLGLFLHFAKTRKLLDPEVTLQPKNSFQRTLRVTGDMDYKPFSYFQDSPQPRGYDIELVTELANRMEYNLELRLMNWNEAVQSIQENKADLILGCDWQDTAVMDCNFTIPTFEEKFVVFQKKPFRTFSDLYSKRIAVIEGCGLQDTLKKYQLWKNCVEYATVTDCVRAVLERECDCFLAHRTIGEISLRKFGDKGRLFRGRMDFASGQMCFGVTKNNQELFAKVNETLLAIRADGTLDALEHKWLLRISEDISAIDYLREHPVILFVTINVTTLVILVILVMCYYLNRIRKEKNRAIAAEKAKDLFFSTVSHDIRTPLNAIIGFSELLKNGIDNQEERRMALNAITTSGNTLLELVNDILNLAKLETNKMVFHLEWTDIAKLASGVLHSFDIAVTSGKTRLVEDFGPIPYLLVDPHRIRQILFNLIGNAVKFTEQGEVRLKMQFEKNENREEGTGKLTLAVADTGYGITPENQRILMQPFVQVQHHDSQKGTGLGLFICRQLAMRMGGELTLVSEFGKGSTFTVTLPEVRFTTKQPELVENDKPLPNNTPKFQRVMVVDDVPVNCHIILAMLKRLGVSSVSSAENGAEALKLLQNSPDGFDVILTDLRMPVMDGETLLQEIRRSERWNALPVYAVTADAELQKSCGPDGFTGVLLKPITLDKLHELLF